MTGQAGNTLCLTSTHVACQELGEAGLTKRPTSCMLLLPKPPRHPNPVIKPCDAAGAGRGGADKAADELHAAAAQAAHGGLNPGIKPCDAAGAGRGGADEAADKLHAAAAQAAQGSKPCRSNPVMLQELGAAGLTKRPTSCMLLLPKPPKGGAEGDDGKEFAESFADVHRRVKAVQPSVF